MIPTGRECKAYYNTGTQAAPVWEEADLIINLDKKHSIEKVKASCRKSGGTAQYVGGEDDHELTFTLCHDNADDVYEFFTNAAWTKTPVHMQILDGENTVSGSDGNEATFMVFQRDESQQLNSVVEDSYTLAPSANGITAADSGIAPLRVTVA